tara:strand:- start:324 stop:1115 length:792 start_codon:yes stop_codon:yes gene_type:complete
LKLRLGLFDSGVGGFSVLNALLSTRTDVEIIYLADFARNPYGEKDSEEIRNIAIQISYWFKEKDIDGLLIACNTTNACALDLLQNNLKIPCFDLINSVSKNIKSNSIGILATTATVKSSFYKKIITNRKPGIQVFQQSCPKFVSEIEKIPIDIEKINYLSDLYLRPLLKNNIKELILGCSHYPLIYQILRKKIASNIKIIDPSIALTDSLNNYFRPLRKYNVSNKYDNVEFFATGNIDEFSLKVTNWLEINKKITLINLRRET